MLICPKCGKNSKEVEFLEAETPDLPVLGTLPADLAVQEADRLGVAVYDYVPALKDSAEKMADKLANDTNV